MGFSHVFQSTLNGLTFKWRSILQHTRKAYQEPIEPKHLLFEGRAQADDLCRKEDRLVEAYGLHSFREQSSRIRYLESLSYLAFLEHLLVNVRLEANPTLRWLDVGAKNWAYVQALVSILTHHVGESYELTGIEIDPFRLYQDGFTRNDYAQRFTEPFSRVWYLTGDVLAHQARYHVISSFLPFVFEDPCLAWGLPLGCFDPERYLHHLVSLLEPDGHLLILNQGELEAEKQNALLRPYASQLVIRPLGPMPETFIDYQYPRFGWYCRKK